MLVEARDLTKFYNKFPAVDRLSFSIDRGEVVGLLGPNGAGKTTTMRMLTCFLPPSDGTATIAGRDVTREPAQARRHLGYMPESNPLYGEMRVREYLKYRAELKGVPRKRRVSHVAECMETANVADVERQVIRTLSKGYRQRVGLADALLGSPDVLVLDEPTIGLDPNQLRRTRETIRRLGESRAVLISTHVLQEVEAVCRRVLIINRGRILADDTIENLGQCTGLVVELQGQTAAMRRALLEVHGVTAVDAEIIGGWTRFTVITEPGADAREAVAALAAGRGWPLRRLAARRTALDETFYRITSQDNAQS